MERSVAEKDAEIVRLRTEFVQEREARETTFAEEL
jgi:hypothetical protein